MSDQLRAFLTLVLVVKNQAPYLKELLEDSGELISSLVSDYEIVVIDNASDDDSVGVLKSLVGENGIPSLQTYALTKEVDADIAAWVGLENALGDFVAVVDPCNDDIGFLPVMHDKAVNGQPAGINIG
jgi:glycosyltransferase involved in cell wall biosynthesis